MARIGFLGVGTISEAMVRAMAGREGHDDQIFLSPRSQERSSRLADEFPSFLRLESNQAVIDASEIVVLGMRLKRCSDFRHVKW
jgi:pyrroline-5-carboxylate reductase